MADLWQKNYVKNNSQAAKNMISKNNISGLSESKFHIIARAPDHRMPPKGRLLKGAISKKFSWNVTPDYSNY